MKIIGLAGDELGFEDITNDGGKLGTVMGEIIGSAVCVQVHKISEGLNEQ